MRMYDIIKKKRDGRRLSKYELGFFVKGYTDGQIPDYQAAAFLMAVFLKGMDMEETIDLTMAMANSGETVDLSGVLGPKADKHSTGGVGDKTTLVAAPIAAACGIKVAKMSGRGLGHTGGTVDKLESVTGYQTSLPRERFIEIANKTGLSIIGQSGNLAPADKKLYALRDVTATVDSLPLIVSSIMSKKIAVGADCIVLDVKSGSGSFCKTEEDAKNLARQLVAVGKGAGKAVTAVITDMDTPLGYAIGNSLEVIEAMETLNGRGPEDLKNLSLEIAAEMLTLAKKQDYNASLNEARAALESGRAFKVLLESVKEHGGDISLLQDISRFPKATYERTILSPDTGYIRKINTESLGTASLLLGAGRIKKEDNIDYQAGIKLFKKTGDIVNIGEPIAVMYAEREELFEAAARKFIEALTFSKDGFEKGKLILGKER